MQTLSIRRGDTLYAEGQLIDEFGAAKPVTGMTIAASLIDKGGYVAHSFGVTVLNDNEGKFALAQIDTGSLPPALYTLQIQYSRNGAKISSTAFELMISKQVSADPVRFAQVSSMIGNTRVLITVPAHEIDFGIWDQAWDVSWKL